ncbi:uncharacterized protein N0V89_000269 [Didymosphaeria variabile]|uniref:Uncharacterized protein n=1 Tax=Didymosphaeria variabile TaxID=1932322 RepID=A0A9W8XUC6_9PLEO|nr:uncharacterized protein N0V89_000269 [Didymosphaeria variabile]KAJ4359713.1 hypothetical protein N0V89_000269 [Didymosphaeria variabile]
MALFIGIPSTSTKLSGSKRLDSEITQNQLQTYKEKRRHVATESESVPTSSLPQVGPCVSPPFGSAPPCSQPIESGGMPTPHDSAVATPGVLLPEMQRLRQPSNASFGGVPPPPPGPAPETPPPPPPRPPISPLTTLESESRSFHSRPAYTSEEHPLHSSSTTAPPQEPQEPQRLGPAYESRAKEGSKLAEKAQLASQGILECTKALASAHRHTRELRDAQYEAHQETLKTLHKEIDEEKQRTASAEARADEAEAKIEEFQKQLDAQSNENIQLTYHFQKKMERKAEEAIRVQNDMRNQHWGRIKELSEQNETQPATIEKLEREKAALQDRLNYALNERDQSYKEILALWTGVRDIALADGVNVTALTEPVSDRVQHSSELEAEGKKRKAENDTCIEENVSTDSRRVREDFRSGQAEA